MPPHRATSAAPAPAGALVSVLLPLPLAGAYDYRVPEGLAPVPGSFVTVPLGSREVTGVVWGDGEGDVAAAKLKDVIAVREAPPLPEATRTFVAWVADYTLSPPGSVLRMAMSVPAALDPPKPVVVYGKGPVPADLRLTPARARVLAFLDDGPPLGAVDLAHEAGVGTSVVKGLAAAGALVAHPRAPPPPVPPPDPARPGPTLSKAQALAADDLCAKARAGGFSVTLLDGVTGAGKTEVYFEAVAAALAAGRQALVLLPEIALTPQLLGRFEARFGAPPAAWHSDLGQATRRATWRAVAEGTVRVVVGARSALFLPYPELGLIVVDEEHESAFKQEEGVIYHARDMAIVRARQGDIPAVLVSATPALETVNNVARERFGEVHLPARHGVAQPPDVAAIDLRREAPPRGGFLAPPLRAAMAETLEARAQTLLFLNRRGYAPLTLCRTCGHRLACPHCTAWLVEHRLRGRLMCHHCGYMAPLPRVCPECGAEGSLVACGPGVERVAEEVLALVPDVRLGVMTSDTVHGPEAAGALLRQVADGEIDVLIGTQMIAKGHHFPDLTLVGVVDADLGLAGGDLRATERTYQLLHQVAGRAGRAERPGRVLLQTYQPEHRVMQALVSGDRAAFLEAEAQARREGAWPPFGRLAALIVSGPDVRAVEDVAAALGRSAPAGAGVAVLGPAPAPLALLRGRHRRRLLLKTDRRVAPQPLLRAWLARVQVPAAVRVAVDVDPYSFV